MALSTSSTALLVEAVGADESETYVGGRVLFVAVECFLEKILGVLIVEALVQQASPADPVERALVVLRDGGAKFGVGIVVAPKAPVAFGAVVGVARLRERLEAGLRFGAMSVEA